MTRGGRTASRAALLLLLGAGAHAGPIDDGVAFYRQRKYLEARAVLEPLVAAEPGNARAEYFLGMTVFRAQGPGSLEQAHRILAKAVKLAPGNAAYLADYAGVCLLLADRDSSFGLALEGRDAMTRAIAGNPDDLEGRAGLMRFYAKAPWPLGDADKALAQAAEIARRDPKRGLAAYQALTALFEKAGDKQEALSAAQAAQKLAPAPAGR